MGVKVTNNGFGTISAGITSSATTIVLDSGQGARFPTLGSGDYFYGTLVDTSNNIEIIKVTARSSDSMTVTRAQDNTSARAFSVGDRFELRPTAALFEDIQTEAASAAELVNDTSPQLGGDLDTQTHTIDLSGNTGALSINTGTTAQRPASPVNGMIRYNTTTSKNEIYQNGGWQSLAFEPYAFEYLIVAGGGGGSSGGGGAGGLLQGSSTTGSGDTYPITIGAGGANGNGSTVGTNGGTSSAFSISTVGGGGGGHFSNAGQNAGVAGGSGGGGGGADTGNAIAAAASGTSGQGNAGGLGVALNTSQGRGGGGGAGAGGANGSGSTGGVGGIGINWQSLGTYYAGGGGGGGGTGSSGGNGGGGQGGSGANSAGGAATANTGGGGGGGGAVTANNGGTGGSGVVIVRYLGSQRGSGGTVTSTGGYTYHTFTSSGTYTG